MAGERKQKDFFADQRGAIMMIGLFMACSLIGALWFLIGIGDAIVFKDRVQEATDHAAFTSAVAHARGMNLIAAINLIMFALVAVYVVTGVIQDVIFVLMVAKIACGVVGGICLTPPAAACCAKAVSLYSKWQKLKNWRERYFNNVIKRVCPPMSKVQTVAGVVYPYLGAAYAWNIGSNYGYVPIAISPSMIPGKVGNAAMGGVLKLLPGFGNWGRGKANDGIFGKGVKLDSRVGLPVKKEKPSKLCEFTGRYFIEWLLRFGRSIPGIGSILGNFFVKKILGYATWAIGNLLQARYCNEGGAGSALSDILSDKAGGVAGVASAVLNVAVNLLAMVMAETDKFWGEEDSGPKTIWKPAKNGAEWMQVWTFTMPTDYEEQSERHVGQAWRYRGVVQTPHLREQTRMFGIYMARAEFYFDCKEKWDHDDCNGDLSLSYSTFAMRWRARERRFRLPDIGSILVEYGLEALMSSQIVNAFKDKFPKWLGGTKIGQALARFRDRVPGLKPMLDQLMRSKNGKGGLDWILDDRRGALYKWYRAKYGAVPDTVILH
jgi:hypothetical protein